MIVSVRVPANEVGRGYSNAKCVPIRPGFPTIIKKTKQKQNKTKKPRWLSSLKTTNNCLSQWCSRSSLTRTTRTPEFWDTPAAPWLPTLVIHIRSQVKTKQVKGTDLKKMPKIQIVKNCKKLYTRHTFSSCLIRCVNMKWIQPEL